MKQNDEAAAPPPPEAKVRAEADQPPNSRAWRRSAIKAARGQVNTKMLADARAAKPTARDLFERRHAAMRVLDASHLEFVRGCTCPIGAPHTEGGTA